MGNLERGDIFHTISGLANPQPDVGSVSLLLWSHTLIRCRFNGQTLSLMKSVGNNSHLQVQLWEKFNPAIGLQLKMLIIKRRAFVPSTVLAFFLFW